MTSSEVLGSLRAWFASRSGEWAVIPQFRAGTGYGTGSNRFLDVWAIQCWPSRPMQVVAVEIKVSRGDFLLELKNPMKRDSALKISNQFYFATPAGLVSPKEIPNESGLIEISQGMAATETSESPHRECVFTLPFIASLARVATNKPEGYHPNP